MNRKQTETMEQQPLPMSLYVQVQVPFRNWYETLEPTLHALRVHNWTYSMIKEWLDGAVAARKMLLNGPDGGHPGLERATRLYLTNGYHRVSLKVTNDFTLRVERDEELK